MATKPTEYPDWATVEQVDPVSEQTNRVEPPTSQKESGWNRREIPPRQWFNWNQWINSLWIRWLDQREGELQTSVDTAQSTADTAQATADAHIAENAVDGPHGITFEEARVELGGDFDVGSEIVISRMMNAVTLTSVGALDHAGGSSASSSAGVIPASFRPTDYARTMSDMRDSTGADGDSIKRLSIAPDGTLEIHHFLNDFTSGFRSFAGDFTISYLIQDNIT